MECTRILEESGEYEIRDESELCPECGTKTKEVNETSSLDKKRFCEKCDRAFIKELFIDCKNKKAEIRLKNP